MNKSSLQFHDLHPVSDDFSSIVLEGLRHRPASIPPKFFYDEKGSKLFDAITELPEYYQTRTEIGILRQYAATIAAEVGTGSLLLEPGGGSCAKVHILLEGLQPVGYVPMDISKEHLHAAATELASQYPWLEVHAACTDFTRHMSVPETAPEGKRIGFFPGSSIGNFTPQDAVIFMSSIAEVVGTDGYLLIGVDLKKQKAILEAAYDDAAGVTAAFNLNLLSRINAELNGNFDLSQWRHKALYNEQLGRIEMHLISQVDQQVKVQGELFDFAKDEGIHTENSYKYTVAEFKALAIKAGFVACDVWTDKQQLFSVHLLKCQSN